MDWPYKPLIHALVLSILTLSLITCDEEEIPINEGQSTLVLSGDITDAEALSIIKSDLGVNTQSVKIFNTNNLTKVDLSALTSSIEIIIENNKSLLDVNLSKLTSIRGPFKIIQSPKLNNIDLSSLTELTDDVEFASLDLNRVDLSSLKTGYIIVFERSGINELLTPNLKTLEAIAFRDESISDISLPSLTAGSISFEMSEINSLVCPALRVSEYVNIVRTQIKNLDLPALISTNRLNLEANASLSAVNLPQLIGSGTIIIEDNPALASLDMSLLQDVIELRINNNNTLAELNLVSLSTVNENLTITSNGILPSINLQVLKVSKGRFFVYGNSNLETLELPQLSTVENLIVGNNMIRTISLNSLIDVTTLLSLYDNHPDPTRVDLIKVELNNLKSLTGSKFEVDGALSSEEVNYLLSQLTSIDPPISNRNIYLSQHPGAPPTGQGILDKNTLINNGNYVSTN